MAKLRPAVFLDRDGTLNVEVSYLTRPEQMQLLPGVLEALQLLRNAGFACVVVTNQSAVGRGMMTEEDLQHVHAERRIDSSRQDGNFWTAFIIAPRSRPARTRPATNIRTANRRQGCSRQAAQHELHL